MAATDASKQNVWLRRLFTDLGYAQGQPTTVFEDNESCLKLSRNYCAHGRVKHLDLREMLASLPPLSQNGWMGRIRRKALPVTMSGSPGGRRR